MNYSTRSAKKQMETLESTLGKRSRSQEEVTPIATSNKKSRTQAQDEVTPLTKFLFQVQKGLNKLKQSSKSALSVKRALHTIMIAYPNNVNPGTPSEDHTCNGDYQVDVTYACQVNYYYNYLCDKSLRGGIAVNAMQRDQCEAFDQGAKDCSYHCKIKNFHISNLQELTNGLVQVIGVEAFNKVDFMFHTRRDGHLTRQQLMAPGYLKPENVSAQCVGWEHPIETAVGNAFFGSNSILMDLDFKVKLARKCYWEVDHVNLAQAFEPDVEYIASRPTYGFPMTGIELNVNRNVLRGIQSEKAREKECFYAFCGAYHTRLGSESTVPSQAKNDILSLILQHFVYPEERMCYF